MALTAGGLLVGRMLSDEVIEEEHDDVFAGCDYPPSTLPSKRNPIPGSIVDGIGSIATSFQASSILPLRSTQLYGTQECRLQPKPQVTSHPLAAVTGRQPRPFAKSERMRLAFCDLRGSETETVNTG